MADADVKLVASDAVVLLTAATVRSCSPARAGRSCTVCARRKCACRTWLHRLRLTQPVEAAQVWTMRISVRVLPGDACARRGLDARSPIQQCSAALVSGSSRLEFLSGRLVRQRAPSKAPHVLADRCV